MAKDFAKTFYQGRRWRDARESYIKYRTTIDGGMCEVCKEQLGYIVHHKIKLTPSNINNPDISLGLDNLQFVCKDCHDKEHFKDIHGSEQKKPRCIFDHDGNPIMIPDK